MNSTNSTIPKPRYAKTSQDPLDYVARRGMYALGTVGLLSTVSTFTLLLFITHRMVCWRQYYEQSMARNQVLLLIYNLLFADLNQSLAFVISFYWLSQDRIIGPHPVCFAQAWFIQIGDVASGLWVLTIGLHTFINLVLRKKVPQKFFFAWVVFIWLFCLGISAAAPLTIKDVFVPTAVWCWIDAKYRWERLYFHYLWIFLAEGGSVVVYVFIVFYLNNQLHIHSENHASITPAIHESSVTQNQQDPFDVSRKRLLKTARYMVLYPAAYVILTSPLAITRVFAMTGATPHVHVYILAGTMMSSCGWIDVFLYISTRKVLVSTKISTKSSLSPWHAVHTWYKRFVGKMKIIGGE